MTAYTIPSPLENALSFLKLGWQPVPWGRPARGTFIGNQIVPSGAHVRAGDCHTHERLPRLVRRFKLTSDNLSRAMLAQIVIWLVEDGKTEAHQLATASVNGFRGLQR